MQIVSDRGADISEEQLMGIPVYYAPLRVTLGTKTYESGVNLRSDEFYQMLSETELFPTTSTPSAGDFVDLYRRLAKTDPEILSIHISSGLSSTYSVAQTAAALVPEAKVTFFDSKTLSCPLGWQVEAAARAVRAGMKMDEMIRLLERVRETTFGLFTLSSLKYLIHGGRISHLKGLVASLLNIKPVIGPDKVEGKYITFGQEMTFRRALVKLVDVIAATYARGSALRVQILHGKNLEGVEMLRDIISKEFDCNFLPVLPVAPVLGAHTGPSLTGCAAGPLDVFAPLA
jgi:DegV family protein with EDD domain